MATWFTSDSHFSHARIIELADRPFADVEEMNEVLIERWNAVVKPTDTVFHLGDVALGKIAQSLPLVARLTGHKVLMPGNHDRIFVGAKTTQVERFTPEYAKVFQEILPQHPADVVVAAAGVQVLISHFPYDRDS